MTYIQPHKSFDLWNFAIGALAVFAVVATFFLVAGYNNTVNTSHNITAMKTALNQIGDANTNLQNQIIAVMGNSAMSRIASQGGLVQDNKPQYVSATGNSQSLTLQ